MIYNIIHTKTFQNEKKRVEGRMKKKKKDDICLINTQNEKTTFMAFAI